MAITRALTLRAVFRLALRQTEGLIGSILRLLGFDLAVPDHSTLSRRAERLEMPRPRSGKRPVHLLVDSTGSSSAAPGNNDAHAAEEALAKLDVPYITAHPLESQTMRQWAADGRGLESLYYAWSKEFLEAGKRAWLATRRARRPPTGSRRCAMRPARSRRSWLNKRSNCAR